MRLPLAVALATWLALAGLSGATFAIVLAQPAQAQEAQPRQGGGLLRYLFGRNDRQQQQQHIQQAPRASQPQRQQRAQPRRRQQPTQSRAASQPAAPARSAAAVDKSEDAKRIVVVGDFLAGGMADGLREAYESDPDMLIVSRSNGSSGLVRDDFYDWPGQIGAILDSEDPDAVIVMIGSNDRQQMVVGGSRVEPRSEAWLKEYEARVRALTEQIAERDLPLLWAGNLPFRPGSMSSDMIAFNDIYNRIVTEAGGTFVDLWTGFSDENGAFVGSGPDIKGQPAQLRAGDGINVTRAGRRKMAFFVEKPLQELLGASGGPGISLSVTDGEGAIGFPTASEPERIDRTAPVALFEADDDLSNVLLGAPVGQTAGDGEHGEAENGAVPRSDDARPGRNSPATPQSRPGRADHFGGPSAAVTAPRSTPSGNALPAGDDQLIR